MSFIYLASPYSNTSSERVYDNYRKALEATACLIKNGHIIFSPIVHCHEMAKEFDMPTGIAFWWKHNRAMMEKASEFHILTLDGWKNSKGIRREAALAVKLQLPIRYMDFLNATKEK
jgi:hypothetical protein